MEVNPKDGYYSLGLNTLKVPMTLFDENRQRLANALRSNPGTPSNAVVLLQAGGEMGVCEGDSSDVGPVFRQESYFHWAFGVLEPDYYGAVEVSTGRSILFMPRLPQEYAIWMGAIKSPKDIKRMYGVDEVYYLEDMKKFLSTMANGGKPTLLTLLGTNTDSGKTTRTAAFDGISEFKTDSVVLFPIIAELRVIKTEEELKVLRYVTQVSSDAHMQVMRAIKPGMKEYQCESTFLHNVYHNGGCRNVSYTCICGTGRSGSVLHYGHANAPNDQTIKDGDIVLFDMGGEYYCFCSDITCSYPANGKFTEKQKVIYNAVLRASKAVIDALKPGVSWIAMHKLANRITLEDLVKAGILKGDVDEMMKVNLAGRCFQPHGLGHFIGNDVHDVGGYLEGHPPRQEGLGLKNLRTARDLKENMVVTVEPGCYFIDHVLDNALTDPEIGKFFVKEKIEEYRGFGGVRIEDDIIITKDGCEVMSIVPRTVEDIEMWMAGHDVKLK